MKIGLVLPIAEDEERGAPPSYGEIRDLALEAEAAGLDSVWVYDHLLFRFPEKPTAGIWEVWTLLSALAEATNSVQIGTIVLCTAFRNPAVLAKMAATLDEISGGRLILGLGAGWHQPEFDAFGIPFDHRVGRFAEALQIIAPLLREGAVDFNGTYYQAPNCEIRPRGPSPRGPEIMVAAFGQRMLKLTAQYADSWNTAWLGEATALDKPKAELEAACTEVGRDPATLGVTVGLSVAYPAPAADESTPDKPRKALAGAPEEVARSLQDYERRGVRHAICGLHNPNSEAIQWLAQVATAFRGLAPEG
jgi:alkanesulfonate monooxygenase SsuD/methylene tetrahydromethanopterin reductase-like flavin-dependent oxidoreductase (luciferase family)